MRLTFAVVGMALGTGVWSSPSLACQKIHVCDFTQNPPCHDICPDMFIARSGPAYAMTLKRLDPKAASAVVNLLSGIGSAQVKGSTLTIKDLNKSDIPQVLDRLNIDRSAVHVPQ